MDTGILEYLQDHQIIDSAAGWRLEPASGGLNTNVYFAIDPAGNRRFTIRTGREREALRLEATTLDRLGHCPGVPRLASTIGAPLLVHEYLPGRTQPLATVGDQGLARLGQSLACIHSYRQDWFNVWPYTQRRTGCRADAYQARLAAVQHFRSFACPGDLQLRQRIHAVFEKLAAAELTAPGWQERGYSQLHGDLSQGNLIWDGYQVGFVDWEYTRSGDAAEEIAYLLSEQPIEAAQVASLRAGYIANGGDDSVFDRLPWYLPLVALDSALWWMDYLEKAGEDPARHPEVLVRVERAEEPSP